MLLEQEIEVEELTKCDALTLQMPVEIQRLVDVVEVAEFDRIGQCVEVKTIGPTLQIMVPEGIVEECRTNVNFDGGVREEGIMDVKISVFLIGIFLPDKLINLLL
jgi:hypothetical protein